jgi:hypothetical protein
LRPAPIFRELRVDSGVSTAVLLPFRCLKALDSLVTEHTRDSGATVDRLQLATRS